MIIFYQSTENAQMYRVRISKHIALSKSAVWKVIASEKNLEKFHPFCLSNEVVQWARESSQDVLIYLNGHKFVRKWTSWNEGVGYSLEISNSRFSADVHWRIVGDKEHSTVEISVQPKFLHTHPIIRWISFHGIIKRRLSSYLRHVLEGLSHYLLTKQVVAANQFGKHSWFS